jgi:hypothetical protein
VFVLIVDAYYKAEKQGIKGKGNYFPPPLENTINQLLK